MRVASGKAQPALNLQHLGHSVDITGLLCLFQGLFEKRASTGEVGLSQATVPQIEEDQGRSTCVTETASQVEGFLPQDHCSGVIAAETRHTAEHIEGPRDIRNVAEIPRYGQGRLGCGCGKIVIALWSSQGRESVQHRCLRRGRGTDAGGQDSLQPALPFPKMPVSQPEQDEQPSKRIPSSGSASIAHPNAARKLSCSTSRRFSHAPCADPLN